MFERFTKDARDVVTGAVEHAERAGAEQVDEGHLLLSLLDRNGSRGSFALAVLGISGRTESVVESLAAARRRGGLTGVDAVALSGLGIDLDAIVSRVEEAHGTGALSGRRSGPRKPRGHRPFTRGAKGILEESLRGALAHRDRRIGDEHLLLALATRPGIASGVLAEHGVTVEALERVLWGEGEAAAG